MSTLGQALPDGVAAAPPAHSELALPPAADDAERAEVRSSQSGLIALAAFVVVVLWVAIALVIRQDYENTGRQAEFNLSNLSRAFAEHTAKTLEGGQTRRCASCAASTWRTGRGWTFPSTWPARPSSTATTTC